MDAKTQARLDARAKVVKAMAHPTRLFILEELGRDERCVQDLQAQVGCDMSTMSKHLSVLKSAGIVMTDKRGTQIYYSLAVPCILNFAQCVDAVMQHQAKAHSDALS